jgi:hypothetical protein
MKSFITNIGMKTLCLLFALQTANGFAQSRTTKVFNSIIGTTNVENPNDSTYVLKAENNIRSFTYKIHNKISLLYLDSRDKKQKKIKGEIVAISDSTITIYQLVKNKQTEVPIKDIIRFSRATKSLFRYMAIVCAISIGEAILAQGRTGDNNIGPSAVIALLGFGFDGYALIPAILGEHYRKHYCKDGWKLKTSKYPNYIVHTIEYRQFKYDNSGLHKTNLIKIIFN